MDVITAIALFISGILAGFVGGLLGTGGCILMMPVLRFGFGYPPALAIGTTLFAVVFTATSGAYAHIRMGNVDKETAKYVAVGGSIGVILGSLVFFYIAEYGLLLDLIVGIAFIYAALRMLYEGIVLRKMPERTGNEIPGSGLQKLLLGLVIGFLTGILGLGGGYALVPAFIYLFGAAVYITMGTSLASFLIIAIIGAAFKLYQGVVDIYAGIAMCIGAALGAQLGPRVMKKIKPNYLKAIFGGVFLYVSLKYILLFFGIYI